MHSDPHSADPGLLGYYEKQFANRRWKMGLLRTIRGTMDHVVRDKLPLVLQATVPLLIASFAFNFNNFSLIYMLTGGGPNYPGAPLIIGETDILISMVYSVAFESGVRQFGLASALSILIFVVVGFISWLGFRQTRKLEEII